ncbi:MAG: thiol-disulfide isomerase/thioredoxin [bacterium]|jgi:thiol-disulfide isomerase/thioredoxin
MKRFFSLFLVLSSIFLFSACENSDPVKKEIDFQKVLQKNFIQQPKTVIKVPEIIFTDLEGKEHTLAEFRGKVVFLNFWATWCFPCRKEMPDMDELYFKMKSSKNFKILALDLGETSATVKKFLKEYPYSFPIGLAKNTETLQKFLGGARAGLPTTFVIDKKGYVIARVLGPRIWKKPELIRYFQHISNLQK